MTVDIEKLKALALAYVYEDGDHWYSVGQLADGITYDPAVNFIADCSAAAVLELIAEVERLSAELAAGAARQGGNTSQVGCERDDGLLNIHAESETCEVCSAPAAGTVEKDAVVDAARKLVKAKGRYHTELNYKALAASLDDLRAHTKAGKE
jgi:hypothetical protein